MARTKKAANKSMAQPLAGSVSKKRAAARSRRPAAAAAPPAAAAAAASPAASYRLRLVRRTISVEAQSSARVPKELKARLMSRARKLDCRKYVGTYETKAAANAAAQELFEAQRRQSPPGYSFSRKTTWMRDQDGLWDKDNSPERNFNWRLKPNACGDPESVVRDGLACHTQEVVYQANFSWAKHRRVQCHFYQTSARATKAIRVDVVAAGGVEGGAGSPG